MVVNTKNHKFIIALIHLFVINSGMAQRPSFAGSRPTGGLNQLDKYHSTTPANTDFQNRFGGSDNAVISNTIPFGQPQKPPIGYPVVVPESVYSAVTTPSRPSSVASSSSTSNGVEFADRFGETNTNTATSTAVQSPLPLDAHGDRELINQLNQIPVDKRPFWFLNYQAIEAQRNGSVSNFAGAQGSRGSFMG